MNFGKFKIDLLQGLSLRYFKSPFTLPDTDGINGNYDLINYEFTKLRQLSKVQWLNILCHRCLILTFICINWTIKLSVFQQSLFDGLNLL